MTAPPPDHPEGERRHITEAQLGAATAAAREHLPDNARTRIDTEDLRVLARAAVMAAAREGLPPGARDTGEVVTQMERGLMERYGKALVLGLLSLLLAGGSAFGTSVWAKLNSIDDIVPRVVALEKQATDFDGWKRDAGRLLTEIRVTLGKIEGSLPQK